MAMSLIERELLAAAISARSHLIEGIVWADHPSHDEVEALAILTEAVRNAGYEPASDIGRRVIMEGDGAEGVITGEYNGYTVFIDCEEQFTVYDNTDQPITRDDFTFVEDIE